MFNPVSFYYCFAEDGLTMDSIVAEITNTPWKERHADYEWRFTAPSDDLSVHMNVLRDGEREFDAALSLQRRSLSSSSLARVLWRYPLMTAQVVGAIHWQALRLWLKRNPIRDHPALR